MMGLKYLNNHASWAETTREERFFCMCLYMNVMSKGKEARFVEIINKLCDTDFDKNENWELGYEVCFYRDFSHGWGKKMPLLSPKRTFDLCLMSDSNIIIIEAKCAEQFKPEQVGDFKADYKRFEELRKNVPELREVKIWTLGLIAEEYYKTIDNNHWLYESKVFKHRFGFLTWEALAKEYNDPILRRGGEVFDAEKVRFDKNNTHGFRTGPELLNDLQDGDDYWVGRKGGRAGIVEDIKDGIWISMNKTYQTNRNVDTFHPSKNWFRLSELSEML